jgi:hypothetical protein
MSGSTGGSWRRSEPRPPKPAALGKPRDLSTATPTDHHLASSLPNQTPSSRRSRPRRCPYRLPDPTHSAHQPDASLTCRARAPRGRRLSRLPPLAGVSAHARIWPCALAQLARSAVSRGQQGMRSAPQRSRGQKRMSLLRRAARLCLTSSSSPRHPNLPFRPESRILLCGTLLISL